MIITAHFRILSVFSYQLLQSNLLFFNHIIHKSFPEEITVISFENFFEMMAERLLTLYGSVAD